LRIVIDKTARRLSATFDDGTEHHFAVTLGPNASDKTVEGDLATPEGEFYVCAKNPRSRHFLSLCLSYPNEAHADRGLAAGLITAEEHRQIRGALAAGRMPPQQTRLGGEIYIHGHAPERPPPSSTRGCIGLDNDPMREIYAVAVIGTPVTIVASDPRR
jgi:murein L,D-transpeptidase YafK